MNSSHIKVILFDLGNVVIHLDEQESYRQIAELSRISYQDLSRKVGEAGFFNEYEKGLISEDVFRNEIRKLVGAPELADHHIEEAWNGMLLKIDPRVIEAISQLSNRKRIMVLSNTNSIHEKAFHKMLREVSSYRHLDQIFEKVYLSHEINQRKPDGASWQHILDDNPGLLPEEILFLDDKTENLAAADAMNIHTKQILHPEKTISLIEKIA
ncbi:MAG: HAD family phosphatase [Cyclobacteriaceae bacterium]